MKTFLTSLFIILSLAQHSAAQGLHIDSTRFITGNKVGTSINYAIPTADKGILFAGEGYDNPGGIIPYFPIDTGVNGNVLIGKIDSNQHISWIKIYGGSDADGAGPSCQTPDGGYAVLANTLSSDGDVTGFKGAADIWLLRLDKDGNLLWEKCYGSSQSDGAISIANTPDNGFIILGTSNGSDGDVPFHYGDFFSMDWVVIKTDSAGHVQWSKDLGGTGDETPSGAILSAGNSYYIVGSTDSKDHDCTDTAWHPGVYTGDDYQVLKLDDTGKVLWDSSYGGSGDDIAYNALYDVRDSTIVIIGTTNSNDYMVTGYQGDQDIWVIKVKENGKLIWEKTLGSPQQESGSGICMANNGGYIAYGWTHPGTVLGGGGDCWLFTLDNSGNEIGNKLFGSNGYDISNSIVHYLNGFAATGESDAVSFTEGTTYGDFDGGGPFISYIDSITLGIPNPHTIEFEIIVYPNPTNNNTTIILPENEAGNLTIINDVGQTVYRERLQQPGYKTINVNDWSAGVYFIKWNCVNGTVQTAKFVKM